MTAPLGYVDFVVEGSIPVFDAEEAFQASTLTSHELADAYGQAVRQVGVVEFYFRSGE